MRRLPLLSAGLLALLLGSASGLRAEEERPPSGDATPIFDRLGTPAREAVVDAALANLDPEDVPAAGRLARALGRAGGAHAAEGLVALAMHPDGHVRRMAWGSAAHLGLRVEALAAGARAALETSDSADRLAALSLLGRIGDGRDVERLLALVEDAEQGEAVRGAAFDALAALGGVAIPPNARRWRAWWRDLDRRDRADLGRALAAVVDPEAPLRDLQRSVLHRLGWIDLVAVRDHARSWLVQPEPALRAEGCRLVETFRLVDLGAAVRSARTFDLRSAYRLEADAALAALGLEPVAGLAAQVVEKDPEATRAADPDAAPDADRAPPIR